MIWRKLQLIRAVLHCAASCCVGLCCPLLRCGPSYPWHPNPDRTALDHKLKLPARMVRPKLACSRNVWGVRPARTKDPIQFRSGTNRSGVESEPKRIAARRRQGPCSTPPQTMQNQRFARDILNASCRRSLSLPARPSLETSSTNPAERAFRFRHPQQIIMLVIRLGDLGT